MAMEQENTNSEKLPFSSEEKQWFVINILRKCTTDDSLSFLWVQTWTLTTPLLDDKENHNPELRNKVIIAYILFLSELCKEIPLESILTEVKEDLWLDDNYLSMDDLEWKDKLLENIKVSKNDALKVVSSKECLQRLEIVELSTAEERFFFILNLFWLESFAAYLQWKEKPIRLQYDIDNALLTDLKLFIRELRNQELNEYALSRWIDISDWTWRFWEERLKYILTERLWISENEMDKLRPEIKKES